MSGEKKTVLVTVHGHSNYETGGVEIPIQDLGYVTDAAVLQVSSNIVGKAKVMAVSATQSGQVPEGVCSSGNIVTMQLYNNISGADGVFDVGELANATSLSGVTAVLIAQGY